MQLAEIIYFAMHLNECQISLIMNYHLSNMEKLVDHATWLRPLKRRQKFTEGI